MTYYLNILNFPDYDNIYATKTKLGFNSLISNCDKLSQWGGTKLERNLTVMYD